MSKSVLGIVYVQQFLEACTMIFDVTVATE